MTKSPKKSSVRKKCHSRPVSTSPRRVQRGQRSFAIDEFTRTLTLEALYQLRDRVDALSVLTRRLVLDCENRVRESAEHQVGSSSCRADNSKGP